MPWLYLSGFIDRETRQHGIDGQHAETSVNTTEAETELGQRVESVKNYFLRGLDELLTTP